MSSDKTIPYEMIACQGFRAESVHSQLNQSLLSFQGLPAFRQRTTIGLRHTAPPSISVHSFDIISVQLQTLSPKSLPFTMLMRRAASRLHTLPSTCSIITRSYSLTSTPQSRFRAPALADITPETAASFDARQREFRERLAAEHNERKRKEQAES